MMNFNTNTTIETDFGFCKVKVDPKNPWVAHVWQHGYTGLQLNRVLFRARLTYNTNHGLVNADGWTPICDMESMKRFDNTKDVKGLANAIFYTSNDKAWSATSGALIDLSVHLPEPEQKNKPISWTVS